MANSYLKIKNISGKPVNTSVEEKINLANAQKNAENYMKS